MGTAVLPVQTIPLLKNSFSPEDTPKWLHDEAIRGSMALVFNDIQGVEDSTFSYGGPAFLDVEGFFLDNLFGDLSTTATTYGGTATSNTAVAIGGTQVSLSGTAGFNAGYYIALDQPVTGLTEIVGPIVYVGTVPTFSATPARFAHSLGGTARAVNSATGGPFVHTWNILNNSSGQPPTHCADTATEILTADGWKTWDALSVGEEVLTYNHETGMSEWQECLEVCAFPAEEREMISMEGRGHSSLTTANHRWPVTTPYRHRATGELHRAWRTSETLKAGDRIPVGAPCASLPQDAKYTDALTELVAWFWTEGDMNGNSLHNVRITQSTGNAANVARIDVTLRSLFGPPSEQPDAAPMRSKGQWPNDGLPRWRRTTQRDPRGHPDKVRFYLNAAIGRELVAVAPGRVVTHEFIRALTPAQLDLFIKVSMLADNCGPTRLSQVSRERAEAFQFAAILAGHATSLRKRTWDDRWVRNKNAQWVVTMKRGSWITPVNSATEADKSGGGWSGQRMTHAGQVWCPRTANQTWYARRNGQCYFTGNTFTDYTSLTSSVGARAYPGACVGVIDITGNSEQLLDFKMTGNAWVSAPSVSTPTNTVSTAIPVPNWRSTVTVNGTQVYDVGEWSVSLKRTLQVYWTDQGTTQNPYIIARGPLDATGMLNYTVPTDESPLTQMLNNTQGSISIAITNGLAGTSTSYLALTLNASVGAFEKAKPDRSAVLVGYQDDWQAVANSANAGGSGGLGPITAILTNNTIVY
jgi:hypothetical protein